MSTTLLKVTRTAHEEVDWLDRLIVKDLQTEPANNKDRLFQSHSVRNMLYTITVTTDRLIAIYKIKIMLGKMKLPLLEAKLSRENNVFSAFYDRLKEEETEVDTESDDEEQ